MSRIKGVASERMFPRIPCSDAEHMRRNDIKVGHKYTNGKGAIREVIAEGPEFKVFPSQEDCDCIQYLQLEQNRGPNRIGGKYNITRQRFANWAVREE